jgi:hypothetical protein
MIARLCASSVGVLLLGVTTLWSGAPYSPPRTPWGDPDLQGTYTNKYEHQTPFERLPGFEGRRVQDVSGAELAAILAKRNQDVIDRPAGVGSLQFRDSLEVTKASRAWLVVDPPDGKIPPLTAAAQRRASGIGSALDVVNARPRSGSSFGDGPFNGPDDLSLSEMPMPRRCASSSGSRQARPIGSSGP